MLRAQESVFNPADFYDAELRWLNARFRAAVNAGRRDRVLDVGCGAGQSTREAARAAVEGSVFGVDVSEDMLQIARRRGAQEGLRNVAFERTDAQSHAFPAEHFDLCISRFGTMFFADPAAAFANISRAMRPEARLVLMVRQSADHNKWSTAIRQALAPAIPAPPAAPAAFSLSDPEVTTGILTAAGFASITFTEVNESVFYGPTVDAAFAAVVGLFKVDDAVHGNRAEIDAALQRLRSLLEAHMTADGVLFDAGTWIVTARKTKP